MSEKFVLTRQTPAKEPLYVRLSPDLIERLNRTAKNTGINRAEIIQQALEYALERLEVKGR